jgi:hypothetical protein
MLASTAHNSNKSEVLYFFYLFPELYYGQRIVQNRRSIP